MKNVSLSWIVVLPFVGLTNVTIDGGNVTPVNIVSNVITSKWAGFFGNISGSLQLTDSSAHKFYEWTISDMTGAVVYAASTTITDWTGGNIAPLDASTAPAWIVGTATDNFSNTFSVTETFTSSSLSEATTPYAESYNNSGVGTLKTYALYSTTDTADIWAGKVIDDTEGFQGDTVDYQILLPAQTGTQYSFYLELP